MTGTDQISRAALTVLQPGFDGTTAPDWVRRAVAEGLGAVGVFARNVESTEQLAALTATLRAEDPDVLVAIDEEGGDVTRLAANTGGSPWPGNLALGTADDIDLTRAAAAGLGRDLAAAGVSLDWAPSVDVNSNPDNPVIGVRSFGADTDLVSRHGVAWIEGLQSTGVAACAKHFPGHGDTALDSHHDLPVIEHPAELLRRRELAPFRAAIAAGVKAVMSAHLVVPALDPTGRPGTLSPRILTDLLRRELGFTGLIVTDGIEMKAVSDTYGVEHGSVLALAAGADAICVGGGLCDEETVTGLRKAIVAAVASGELPEERLLDAARRVRELAAWSRAALVPGGAGGDHAIGLDAARRAVHVAAPGAPVTGPAHVVRLTATANIAVGDDTAWGLTDQLPGSTSTTADADTPIEEIVSAAAGRRIVAVVRDTANHPWMADTLRGLLAARPDTAVVDMGLPTLPPIGAPHLRTHGAARVCAVAAGEALRALTHR